MKQYRIRIDLLEDVILTANSATVGAPRTVDYIPGATLYGACASRLYQKLNREAQFVVFHSGRVRFGNGLPLSHSGQIAWPVPFCWHTKKGDQPLDNRGGRFFNKDNILNMVAGDKEFGTQYKQLREHYVCSDGECVRPRTTLRMKTAIKPHTATAATAQLFGYAAIQAGQSFESVLQFDEDISDELQHQVIDIFQEPGRKLRIGRSRSRQYGTIECAVSNDAQGDSNAIFNRNGLQPSGLSRQGGAPTSHYNSDSVTFWLLSDMALRDSRGNPALQPAPEAFGLPDESVLDRARTFIRTRQYSPYNSKRMCHDQDRQVLVQGSVVTFSLPGGIPITLDSAAQSGFGDYRHSGLGQVALQPALLETVRPLFDPVAESGCETVDYGTAEKNDLVIWLQSRADQAGRRLRKTNSAAMWLDRLRELYISARHYAALDDNSLPGPGKSQWSRVGHIITSTEHNLLPDMLKTLVDLDSGSQRVQDADWGIETGLAAHEQTFGHWLLSRLEKEDTDIDVADTLLEVSRLALDLVESLQSGESADASGETP